VHTGQIGEILKVRLSLEARPRSSAAATVAAASAADLPVGRLVMTDADTSEELRFDFNCSLGRAMMCKELPALGRDGRPVLPVERYTLEVHTGDLYNAGTSAAVTVTLHGDLGDTGPRELLFDRVDDKDFQVAPFMKGQVDKFSLEAVHLGRLTKLSVCHDAREPGHGWYLDKVAVRPESQPDEAAEFLCYRWLDSAEDDGRLARDLRPLRRQSAAAAASAGVPPDEQPALQQLERSSWQGIAWMFENNCTVQLYCPATGRPVRVNSDTSGKAGAQCEFRLRPHELLPRSVVVASARRPSQQLLLNADGRQSTLSTSKKAAAATSLPQPLVPHCRGGSGKALWEQALAVEQDGRRLNGAGGFVTLRSCSSGLWLGFEPDGRAVPVSDDAERECSTLSGSFDLPKPPPKAPLPPPPQPLKSESPPPPLPSKTQTPPPPALGPDEWLLGFADFDAKKSSVSKNLASVEATVCFGSGDAAATASATILPQSDGEVRLRLALKSASADEAASRPELWKLRLDLIPQDPRLAATWQPPPTLRRLLLWKPALQTTNQAKASLSIEFRLPATARLFWPAASTPGDAASAQASLEVPAGRQAVADYQLRLVTLKASTSADGGPLRGCLRLELVLEVQLSAVDLGQLRLCRISADSREASGAWNCDRLIAARLGPGFSVTDFLCCDWLRPRGSRTAERSELCGPTQRRSHKPQPIRPQMHWWSV
uniref:PLAT domain-containing protein n=1 Tax=Macrostomum lignano TaxID=282301 RepID=A0A1I8FS84_9PLAT